MISNIRNGKLVPPASLPDAVRRRQLLAREVARIATHLGDPARARLHASPAHYEKWRAAAAAASKLFEWEERLLVEWIEGSQAALLRECWGVLADFDEDDLSEGEVALVRKLDRLFAETPQQPQQHLKIVRE